MNINLMKANFPESPWFVAFVFLLLVGPFALDFHMHYPDEMYYSDGAVRMKQNQDYLTTYLGSGELRFKKPILTYWAVLAGFELFGISAFSSRIFFLLAGACTILLVYQIGKVTFVKRKTAYLACLITATHPVVIFSSTRSIPDILLALFITLSALGFAGMLKYGDRAPKRFLWMIYVGLGLAFQVKGLPAAAFGGIGLLYLLLNPWNRISLMKLLYLPAVFAGLAVAVFWFVSMYIKFGTAYLDSFFSDQVGARVAMQVGTVIKNLLLAVLLMGLMYFPWIFLGLKNFRSNLLSRIDENRAFFGWVIVWILSIILMSAMVTKFYERYLLPVVPLASVGLAWLLSRNDNLTQGRVFKVAFYGFMAVNVLLLSVALFVNLGMGASWPIYTGLAAGILAVIILLKNRRHTLTRLAISILLVFYLGSFITYQISLPHQGNQLADFVEKRDIPSGSDIAFVGHLHAGSKIRIGLGKDYSMTDLPKEKFLDSLEHYDYVIFEEDIKDQLVKHGFRAETASLNWDPKRIGNMLKGILSGNHPDVLEQNGKRYYWGQRN